jgi:hypothetical protein
MSRLKHHTSNLLQEATDAAGEDCFHFRQKSWRLAHCLVNLLNLPKTNLTTYNATTMVYCMMDATPQLPLTGRWKLYETAYLDLFSYF